MGRWREKIERLFSAVAFAEANDRDSALQMMGVSPSTRRVSIDDVLTAVTFAEAGCPELAREFLGEKEAPPRAEPVDFAAAVGLKGVRIWYGVAQVAA